MGHNPALVKRPFAAFQVVIPLSVDILVGGHVCRNQPHLETQKPSHRHGEQEIVDRRRGLRPGPRAVQVCKPHGVQGGEAQEPDKRSVIAFAHAAVDETAMVVKHPQPHIADPTVLGP